MVCHVHGWKNLAPFNWDDRNSCLRFAVYIDSESIDISVFQRNFYVDALISSRSKVNNTLREKLKAVIIRSLALEVDTAGLLLQAEKVGPQYIELIKQGAGRLLRAPTLWEDAAKTLFTTNCSWALTKKMCEAVCSNQFVMPTPSGHYPFPEAAEFLKYDELSLKKSMPIGYRAGYFISLAKQFTNDPNPNDIDKGISDSATAFQMISQFKGFGSYASNHMLILTGFFDKIPIDTVVISYLKNAHRVRKPESFIKRHYRKWGAYRWWGFKLEKMLNKQNCLGD